MQKQRVVRKRARDAYTLEERVNANADLSYTKKITFRESNKKYTTHPLRIYTKYLAKAEYSEIRMYIFDTDVGDIFGVCSWSCAGYIVTYACASLDGDKDNLFAQMRNLIYRDLEEYFFNGLDKTLRYYYNHEDLFNKHFFHPRWRHYAEKGIMAFEKGDNKCLQYCVHMMWEFFKGTRTNSIIKKGYGHNSIRAKKRIPLREGRTEEDYLKWTVGKSVMMEWQIFQNLVGEMFDSYHRPAERLGLDRDMFVLTEGEFDSILDISQEDAWDESLFNVFDPEVSGKLISSKLDAKHMVEMLQEDIDFWDIPVTNQGKISKENYKEFYTDLKKKTKRKP